jgi:hypothetical protein
VPRRARPSIVIASTLVLLAVVGASAAPLQVVAVSPLRLAVAPTTAAVTITFDRAVQPASITAASFRAFGRQSGAVSGPFAFSGGNTSVTLTPSHPFSAGEVVLVNLSHAITAADSMPLRSAGYAYQFRIATTLATRTFSLLQQFSNRSDPGTHTQVYGAMASDLNGDGWVDLTTVNEVSADLRTFLNRADGSGQYTALVPPPFPIGDESSPNEPGDFNGDGKTDIAIAASSSNSVWIVRGNGDGTWASSQEVPVDLVPHGIAVLDVDGDGDWDVASTCYDGEDVALSINNGGTFAPATFFDTGQKGEYALASGDMNNDGITDLIVGAQNSQTVIVLLGNGDGTFTPQTPQSAGGLVWKLVVGDVDGDGNLDVAAANGDSNNAAILLGNGDGTLRAPQVYPTAAHVVGSALGDLDGDGDLDWVVSSYGGGVWHVFVNDGSGHFTRDPDIAAVSNPSCAILLDVDNDGDLDLALTDEIADVVKIMQNGSGPPPPPCPPAPDGACRTPAVSGAAFLQLVDRSPDTGDRIVWKWLKGKATPKVDFGNPITTDTYLLCMYDNDQLVSSELVAGSCGAKPCWTTRPTGFAFKNKGKTVAPTGVRQVQLKEGLTDGAASIQFKGRGANLDMPGVSALTGPIDVQLRKVGGSPCWGARYSAPFLKHAAGVLKDRAD